MISLLSYHSDIYDLFNIPRPLSYKSITQEIYEIEDRMWFAAIARVSGDFLGFSLSASNVLDLFNDQPNVHQQWIGCSYVEKG